MKRMVLALATVASAAAVASPAAAQAFGNSVVVDGDQLFVGEPVYDQRSGVVYVFSRDASGSWSQTQRLEPASAEVQNRFGIRLAKQDDVLLVSATRADDGTGAVYVYRDQGGTWTESGRLEVENRSPADSLGSGLAIDGDWVMIGSISDNGARGAAYAFRRSGDTWVQHSKLTPTQLLPEDRFGADIALDGDRMLVAASNAGGGQGAVYAFAWDDATDSWTDQGQLQAPALNQQSAFGSDIAVEGDLALVGTPGFLGSTGAVLVYGSTGDAWELQTFLTPFETQGGTAFGGSIAFDGTTLMVGAGGGGFGNGRVFTYTRDGSGAWTGATQLASDENGQAYFGATVAMTGDVAVGAALNADRGAGSAWVLERGTDGWSVADRLTGDDPRIRRHHGRRGPLLRGRRGGPVRVLVGRSPLLPAGGPDGREPRHDHERRLGVDRPRERP